MRTNRTKQFLPDTNILVHHVRESPLDQRIKADYPLSPNDPTPALSIVIVGEIRSLAEQFAWGTEKRQRITDFIARCDVIPLEYPGLIEAYVDLDNQRLRAERKMGDNDLWIAATAQVLNATLLTTNKDFDHLHPVLIQSIYIDPILP